MTRRNELVAVIGAILLAGCVGCSPGVPEDRSINYSAEGGEVAFQHGEEGVFVASSDGKSMEKIFDSKDVLASSSPLWSPIDKRLIFTTVEPLRDEHRTTSNSINSELAWNAFPEGRPFYAGLMEYTCWLREAPVQDTVAAATQDKSTSKPPKPLFSARCNHSGYVAANLAIRWHPAGQKIVFVDQVDETYLGLFEFDLQSSVRRSILDKRAQAIVFGWSPGGEYLIATLHGTASGMEDDGVWLVRSEQITAPEWNWWLIPDSNPYQVVGYSEPLEILRRSQPVWNQDESRLAFPVAKNIASGQNVEYNIVIAEPATRQVTTLLTTSEPLRDLHWHPDGKRLGFVEVSAVESKTQGSGNVDRDAENSPDGKLKIVPTDSAISELANTAKTADAGSFVQDQVRQFVGWNASGDQLAVIVPVALDEYQHKWCLLFPAVPRTRDRVLLLDSAAAASGKAIHEGMRITFPQWSPTANQLSLWCTFTPTHRSWLSMVLQSSLRPGDPAAILDGDTGSLSWLAVNAHEQSQVGHYYMLKRDYAQAWEWYERGARDRAEPESQALQEMLSLGAHATMAQEPWFFEYYCLTKLGRSEEAATRLANFRRMMSFHLPTDGEQTLLGFNLADAAVRDELQRTLDLLTPLIQWSYACEVFLSLNASADGTQFFRDRYDQATDDAERLAAAICLTQMQLAAGKHAEYAGFVTAELLPLVERLTAGATWPVSLSAPAGDSGEQMVAWREQAEASVIWLVSGISCLPLGSAEFQMQLDEVQIRELLPVWQAAAERSELPIDVVVVAMQDRLGEDSTAAAAKAKDAAKAEETGMAEDIAEAEDTAMAEDTENWLPEAEFQIKTPQQVDQLIKFLSRPFQ